MDNIPEREQPKPERTVKLGEEFQLFDPKHINIYKWDDYDQFDYRFLLNIEDNFQLPLTLKASVLDMDAAKGDFLLPFGPREDGYHIDNADFEVETRRQKLKRLHEEPQEPLEQTKNQLWLFIDSDADELIDLELSKGKHGQGFSSITEFPDKMLDLFRRLRINLKTPEGLFEAMPLLDYKKSGAVIFASFYPADLGPLAAYDSALYENGLMLAVPSDLNKLSQIRAMFVLAEEEPRAIVSQT